MSINILDSETKNRCVNWFNKEIRSELGVLAEDFLNNFPFPYGEKHSLTSFLQTIENNQYLSLPEMFEHFKDEADYIARCLGNVSEEVLYINSFLYIFTKKMREELLPPESDIHQKVEHQIGRFGKIRDKIPSNRDEFLEMTCQNNEIVPMYVGETPVFNPEPISQEEAENLKNILATTTDESLIFYVAEVIQMFEPSYCQFNKKKRKTRRRNFVSSDSDDDDDDDNDDNNQNVRGRRTGGKIDIFKYDFSLLSKGTYQKICDRINQNAENGYKQKGTSRMMTIPFPNQESPNGKFNITNDNVDNDNEDEDEDDNDYYEEEEDDDYDDDYDDDDYDDDDYDDGKNRHNENDDDDDDDDR